MIRPIDGRDDSAADHQPGQSRTHDGGGPMPHDGAHSPTGPDSPGVPLSWLREV